MNSVRPVRSNSVADHPAVITTHYPLLTTHYPLLTLHGQLRTLQYPLLSTHSPRLTTHYSLPTTRHSPLTTPYPLSNAHYSLLPYYLTASLVEVVGVAMADAEGSSASQVDPHRRLYLKEEMPNELPATYY